MWLSEQMITIQKQMTLHNYDQAIALINELLATMARLSKDDETFKKVEAYCLFQRGFIYMELGRFDAAAREFLKYVNKYPRQPNAIKAHLLRADALAAQKKWPGVIKLVSPLKDSELLDPAERLAMNQLLAEAYFATDEWRQAISPFLYVYRHAGNRDVRMHANVSLTVCLIRLELFEDLFKAIPRIFRTPARFSFMLNMALLEEADRLYNSGQHSIPLMLYRLIASKSEILEYLEGRNKLLNSQISSIEQAGSDIDAVHAMREARRLKREQERLEKDILEVKKTPDYEAEVMIRVANCYFAMERYYTAKEVFRKIVDQFPKHELAERALYSLFTVEYAMGNIEAAIEEGEKYIEQYRSGEFWEPLTLNIATLHLQRDELQEAVAMATEALSSKDHRSRANLMFLRGYALFNLDQVPLALKNFELVSENFKDSPFAEPAAYWHAMCRLFMKDNAQAIKEFNAFRKEYLGGLYYEDASYRLGVAHYQMGENQIAENLLRKFIADFPDSNLRSEAASLLGSIMASEGRLDEALEMFKDAAESGVNMVQVNYAVFEAARTLELENRYEQIEDLFRNYLDEWGAQGNVTEAIYWLGKAKMGKGDREGALQVFFDGIMKYGNDPKAYGIDMIISDLVSERMNSSDETYMGFMRKLFGKIDETREQGLQTLNYRLLTMFAMTKDDDDPALVGLVETFLRDRVLKIAAPITLALMGEKSEELGRIDFARKVYAHFLENYADSDFALNALKGMADISIAEGDYEKAEDYLDRITARFSMLPDAGWARVRAADIYRNRADYESAIDAYNMVLSVKEWRGPMWAESLYKIGLCQLGKGDIREAFAFFQRVYVMYAGYPEWAAKAYIKSAECLLKLNLRADAIRTYKEMLLQDSMSELPEAEVARRKLDQLGAR